MSKNSLKSVKNLLVYFVIPKRIVNFYYNLFVNHSNLLKKNENIPINNIEHKNCLSFLKMVSGSSINFIY